jgi:hypothetical protein
MAGRRRRGAAPRTTGHPRNPRCQARAPHPGRATHHLARPSRRDARRIRSRTRRDQQNAPRDSSSDIAGGWRVGVDDSRASAGGCGATPLELAGLACPSRSATPLELAGLACPSRSATPHPPRRRYSDGHARSTGRPCRRRGSQHAIHLARAAERRRHRTGGLASHPGRRSPVSFDTPRHAVVVPVQSARPIAGTVRLNTTFGIAHHTSANAAPSSSSRIDGSVSHGSIVWPC